MPEVYLYRKGNHGSVLLADVPDASGVYPTTTGKELKLDFNGVDKEKNGPQVLVMEGEEIKGQDRGIGEGSKRREIHISASKGRGVTKISIDETLVVQLKAPLRPTRRVITP